MAPVQPDLTSAIMTWSIPGVDGTEVSIQAIPGRVVTIVGANGVGKSALATWMAAHSPYAHSGVKLTRLLAQRRLWFESAGPTITSADRVTLESNLESWDRDAGSRYRDHADRQRASVTLYDLLGHINDENRRVADLVEAGAGLDDVRAAAGPRLMGRLNSILLRAGLHVELRVTIDQTFSAKHRTLGVEYPIFQMSDGERSALLLAAEILTAPAGVVMIDEPERHLHRSISAGLIDAIISERADCSFVVLTHDLELAAALSGRSGQTLNVAGVEWSGTEAVRWRIHEIASTGELSELARRAILGGRQRVLFIEGDHDSLDLRLYGVLLPAWTLMPAGSCDLVIRSVAGLRGSDNLHWVEAAGLVDGDGRSETERSSLESRGVRVLPVFEVENLYYLPAVIEAVARKQSATLGRESHQMVEDVILRALAELGTPGTIDRLARKLAKDEVARRLLAYMPENVDASPINVGFDSPFPNILARLNALCVAAEYEELVRAVPIRDTGLRNAVAVGLGFRTFRDYQAAALVCVAETDELVEGLRREIGHLAE